VSFNVPVNAYALTKTTLLKELGQAGVYCFSSADKETLQKMFISHHQKTLQKNGNPDYFKTKTIEYSLSKEKVDQLLEQKAVAEKKQVRAFGEDYELEVTLKADQIQLDFNEGNSKSWLSGRWKKISGGYERMRKSPWGNLCYLYKYGSKWYTGTKLGTGDGWAKSD